MTLEFQGGPGTGWRAPAGRIAIFIDDRDGNPDPVQVAFANRFVGRAEAIEKQAAQYLDMFVDRARASGKAVEPWWFEEIEMRGLKPGTCQLAFTLDGDDGGIMDGRAGRAARDALAREVRAPTAWSYH